jgi:hypothetical protein
MPFQLRQMVSYHMRGLAAVLMSEEYEDQRKAGAASEHASARTAGGTATATAADGWGCSASFDEDVEQDVPSSGLAAQSTAAASTAAPADYATTAAVASAVPVASGGTRPDASPSVRDGMLPECARPKGSTIWPAPRGATQRASIWSV